MEYRLAVSADIPQLIDLRIEYLKEDLGNIEESMETALRRDLRGYFEKHLNSDMHAYIASEGEKAASCALLLIVEKPMSPSFPNGRTGTVFSVYTRPEFRRKGAARKVMNMLLEDAVKNEVCVVELKATKDGYPLYKSLGFTESGTEYTQMKWKNF